MPLLPSLPKTPIRWSGLSLAVPLFLAYCWGPQAAAFAQDKLDYLRDIKPILHEKCFSCHGGLKQKAKLRVDTVALMKKGGRTGPVLLPGDPAASLIVQRVTSKDNDQRMPPDAPPLTEVQIAKLKAWIAQGAVGPAKEEAERDPLDHWAFRVPQRPKVPESKEAAWSKNPIDAFIAAEWDKRGLTHRSPADRGLLLRRVYLDLIGLPPTPEQLQAFLADPAPGAYEQIVQKLLDSPQYAERWARHWMDVWRYSDWYGRRMVPDVWNSAPQIWRWRDWIVRSLQEDKGYDRMVQEMLAADEIAPGDDQAAVATGYLVRNWYALNPNDWMRANVEHTAKGFLGLTFNCAHCHDHKYDPISHEDYFRFRAFFETIGVRQDRVAGEADPGPYQEYDYSVLRKIQRLGMVRIFDKNPAAPTWFYAGGDERNRVKEKGSLPPGVPTFLGQTAVQPVSLPTHAYVPALRPGVVETLLQEKQGAITKAQDELRTVTKVVEAKLLALRADLQKKETDFESAVKDDPGQMQAARQSLVLDATTGRRTIYNALPGLSQLADGTTVRFDVHIVKDAHFNFQFIKDLPKGLTAAMVAFDQGKILSYQPGGFTEFTVGKFDVAGGLDRMVVEMVLQTKADRCLLTVTNRQDGKKLVDSVPVALNGWNPVGAPNKPILFDARPGSVVRLEEWTLLPPGIQQGGAGERRFDFGSKAFPDGRDVVGTLGWVASPYSVAPATSQVTRQLASPRLRGLDQQVRAARRALATEELPRKLAAARLEASQADLASVQARLAADRAKYGEIKGADPMPLYKAASAADRAASVKTAQANLLAAEQTLIAAETKPVSDPKRAAAIQTATKQLGAAQAGLATAQAKLNEPLGAYASLGPVYPATSTGRRSALARWITSKDNPLTARVAVNHIWLRHFHSPLVASVYDFGRNGAAPTHPELLDWLAVELMESGWSMKKLHRLIVTSQTYRMASSMGQEVENFKKDPENRYLWRMNVGKMEAEVVRDSLLFVAGQLDLAQGGQELENSQSLTTRRRSLYYSCHPEGDGKSEFAALFDAPEATECYRRTRTVMPQQALALTNSDFVHGLSAHLAKNLQAALSAKEQASEQSFIQAAFVRLLARPPTAGELSVCSEFLQSQKVATPEARARAYESLVRSLLNHNDFVTIR